MMCDLRISLIQTVIDWENKRDNLSRFEKLIKPLAGKTDLVVFPEMFTTGFSTTACSLAETNEGMTINVVKDWASNYGFAVTGSFIAIAGEKCSNRAFFVCPNGDSYFYDKRHLFTPGGEDEHFAPGNKRLIVSYKGWNIGLLICYDLRFPVWSRNVNNEYDILIVVANWPASRQFVWDTLLTARALENQAYVCGVNRVGADGTGLYYSGHSRLVNAKGKVISVVPDDMECIETVTLNKKELDDFRNKFSVWADADRFEIC